MNLDKYDCLADPQYRSFTFQSIGPNGIIKKIVNYKPIPDSFLTYGRLVVNLGFGDWDEVEGKVDDVIVSDNRDRDKILATVAATIIAFTDMHGTLPIYAEGSSPGRTRLYQMGINAHLKEVESLFWVYGFKDGEWMMFQSGTNYEAFLVVRK
jgi:hypothetical protein